MSPLESTGVHFGVDRSDADGIGIFGQESTSPATPAPLGKHPFFFPSIPSSPKMS